MKLASRHSSGNSEAIAGANNTTVYKRLSVQSLPSEAESVVNRQYLDNMGLSPSSMIGQVSFFPTSTPPINTLRCNGAQVSKTTYADLYTIIGDTFAPVFRLGSGKACQLQYGFNDVLNRDLYSWFVGTSMPAVISYTQPIVTNNRVYTFGRYSGSTYSSTVYTAPINANGTLGTWTTGTALPATLAAAQAVAFSSYVYVFGGTNGTPRSSVYRATMDTSGTLSAWTTLTPTPFTVHRSQMLVVQNRLYVLGGMIDGVASGKVYYTDIDVMGNLTEWLSGPALPAPITDHSAAIIGNRLYVFGGAINGVDDSLVFWAHITPSGELSDWHRTTSLVGATSLASVVTTTQRVYLLGGYANGTASSKVYSATINPDNTLGAWALYGQLPTTTYAASVVLTSSTMYLLGGYRNGAVASRVDGIAISGGLNSYMAYNDQAIQDVQATTFSLPDYSDLESMGLYACIRYSA